MKLRRKKSLVLKSYQLTKTKDKGTKIRAAFVRTHASHDSAEKT